LGSFGQNPRAKGRWCKETGRNRAVEALCQVAKSLTGRRLAFWGLPDPTPRQRLRPVALSAKGRWSGLWRRNYFFLRLAWALTPLLSALSMLRMACLRRSSFSTRAMRT
jgi:hypothetical protein